MNEPKLYVELKEPVVNFTPTSFIIDGDIDLKSLSNEVKCKWIKMLINHVGVADEEIKPPSLISRYIYPAVCRAVTSAKHTLFSWITDSRAWGAVKGCFRKGAWGTYRH